MNGFISFKRRIIGGKSKVSFIRKLVLSSPASQLQQNLPMH